MMKKLVTAVALAAALVVSRGATAATYDVFATQASAGSTSWALSVSMPSGGSMAGLNIVFGGVTAMDLNPAATGISLGDSLFIDDLGNSHSGAIINGAAGAGGTSLPIVSGPVDHFLLATLTGSAAGIQLLPGTTDDSFVGTVFVSPSGQATLDFSLTVVPAVVVPEPTVALLLGMGLAGLALARRKA